MQLIEREKCKSILKLIEMGYISKNEYLDSSKLEQKNTASMMKKWENKKGKCDQCFVQP